jgi:hypothetical protein
VVDRRQTQGIRGDFTPPHDAHSTRMVNDWFRPAPIDGFEMVDAPMAAGFRATMVINRKFTPNRMSQFPGKIPAILPQ